MTKINSREATPAAWVVSEIEDALFEVNDDAVTASAEMRWLADEARTVICAAARNAPRSVDALPMEPRRRTRRLPRRAGPRRVMMRELLVANPRARDIVGKRSVEAMTDKEVDAALARLAALGLLSDRKD